MSESWEGDRKTSPASASALDVQVGGSHYKTMRIQPWEFIWANRIGYFEGEAIAYVARHKSKNGIDDLKKARHTLDFLIESMEKDADKL